MDIGGFFVGVADCFGFALALSIAGKWFKKGLSLFNFAQSFTVAVTVSLHIALELDYLLFIYVFMHILSSFCLLKNR